MNACKECKYFGKDECSYKKESENFEELDYCDKFTYKNETIEKIYFESISLLNSDNIDDLYRAKEQFDKITEYEDVCNLSKECQYKIKRLYGKSDRKIILYTIIIVLLIVIAMVYGDYYSKSKKYNEGIAYLECSQYQEALEVFSDLHFKDSEEKKQYALNKTYVFDDIEKMIFEGQNIANLVNEWNGFYVIDDCESKIKDAIKIDIDYANLETTYEGKRTIVTKSGDIIVNIYIQSYDSDTEIFKYKETKEIKLNNISESKINDGEFEKKGNKLIYNDKIYMKY